MPARKHQSKREAFVHGARVINVGLGLGPEQCGPPRCPITKEYLRADLRRQERTLTHTLPVEEGEREERILNAVLRARRGKLNLAKR